MSALKIKSTNSGTEHDQFPSGRLLLLLLILIAIAPMTGCLRNAAVKEILSRPVIDYRDMVWARRAFNLRYGNCDRQFGNHFEEGFVAGYCSVCEGGDGYVPALPPEEYWGYEYQSAEGSQCVNAWFEGYPLGAAAARKDNVGKYHDVFISKMINRAVTMDKAPNKMPGDVPIQQKPDSENDGINPELKLDAPPKPVGVSNFSSPNQSNKTPLLYSRSAPNRIPVDPSDNVPLPMSLRPVGVQTASGFDANVIR